MNKAFKTLTVCIIILSLVLCSGCFQFLKGSTEVLDANPIETLKADYDKNYPLQNAGAAAENIVKAQIISETNDDLYYVGVRVINNDPDSALTVYGYGYVTAEPVADNTRKLLLFNIEKNVANSTYQTVISEGGYCADIQYEVQEPTVKVTPETLIFIFFSINDEYYAGAATINDDFTYWKIENHESEQ